MERLTERDSYWLGEEFWTSAKEPDDKEIDNVYAKLKEYEDLEEQGLLIRLPCKVGDTVWEVDTIELYCDEYRITNINITEHRMELPVRLCHCNRYGYRSTGKADTEETDY